MKTFPPIAATEAAPGEAAIEIYADPTHSYVEVEQQGPFASLLPGQRTDWTVTWRLGRLPAALALGAANPELVAAARALVRA